MASVCLNSCNYKHLYIYIFLIIITCRAISNYLPPALPLQNACYATVNHPRWAPAAPTTWRRAWRVNRGSSSSGTPRSRLQKCPDCLAARQPNLMVSLTGRFDEGEGATQKYPSTSHLRRLTQKSKSKPKQKQNEKLRNGKSTSDRNLNYLRTARTVHRFVAICGRQVVASQRSCGLRITWSN